MVPHLRHRQPRGHQVAEALALTAGTALVDGGA
jgi:hypothetical protein